ncbi:hypothetical protein ABB22_07780 [Stenotrophomonas nitritireducens]|uniref:Secreted protein n=1 Tax=Stenotrophomonas nitritireducens TaxID=83617 RepID=A0ABR5NKN8_9GAMM|nr:hypothetical protein ABB22_07780 [Stenotrophomonas nitritireducens]
MLNRGYLSWLLRARRVLGQQSLVCAISFIVVSQARDLFTRISNDLQVGRSNFGYQTHIANEILRTVSFQKIQQKHRATECSLTAIRREHAPADHVIRNPPRGISGIKQHIFSNRT